MLLVLTAFGCAAWIDQEPACDQDVYWWSDDLLAHILTGDGSGSFDYDPVDEPRTRIAGAYEASDGDFSWTETYADGYYLAGADVTGFGTVFHNGNLDLYLEQAVTDVLGSVFRRAYRVQRDGCDMTTGSWDLDTQTVADAVVASGSYTEASVWSWTAAYEGASFTGTLRDTLLRTQDIAADDGSYSYAMTEEPTGESTTAFTAGCGDGLTCEGSSIRRFDGTLEESYDAYDGEELIATVEGAYAYDGSGTSTVTYTGGPTCTFTYGADASCTYSCDDGQSGTCG